MKYINRIHASFTGTVLIAWLVLGYFLFFRGGDVYIQRVFIIVTVYILFDKILHRISLFLTKRELEKYRKDLQTVVESIDASGIELSEENCKIFEKVHKRLDKDNRKNEKIEEDGGGKTRKKSKWLIMLNPGTWFSGGL